MKKVNIKNKKGFEIALGLVVTIAVCSVMASSFINKAAGGNEYVTKDKLMEPISDSQGKQVQKIFFGKNEDGSRQEWYLVGKDEKVSGDNVVIVAANPIKATQVFEDEGKRNKTDENLWADCTYESGVQVTQVHPNHYGTSALRTQLKDMLDGNTYFTNAQKEMMNASTISVYDTRNRAEYTITDKLYALSSVDGVLYAGSANDIRVDMDATEWFWLRTAPSMMQNKGDVLTANGENKETSVSVDMGRGVLPVANLDVSSVLFASAAPSTGAGDIDSTAAMTLRMDGSSQNIGTVTYDETSGTIFVKSNKADGAISLIVLGPNQDWYYSKSVNGTESVTADMIEASVENASDISLEECTVWIETTDDTTRLTYAQMAVAGAVIDATGDGILNTKDLVRYKSVVAGVEGAAFANGYDADWNGDGIVNDVDVKLLRRYLVSDGATITEIVETENMDCTIASGEYKGMRIEGASTNYNVAVQGYVTKGKNIRLAVEIASKHAPETVVNPYSGMSQNLFIELGFGENTGNGDCTLVKANVLGQAENASAVAKTTYDSTDESHPYKTVVEMWIPKESITNNTNENFIPITRMALFHEADVEDSAINWLVAKWAGMNNCSLTTEGIVSTSLLEGIDGVITEEDGYGSKFFSSSAAGVPTTDYYMEVRGKLLDGDNLKIALTIDSVEDPRTVVNSGAWSDYLYVQIGLGNKYAHQFANVLHVDVLGKTHDACSIVKMTELGEDSPYNYRTVIEMYVPSSVIENNSNSGSLVHIPRVYMYSSKFGGYSAVTNTTESGGPYAWWYITPEGISHQ